MPPEVGNADTNSDMHNPMTRMNTEMIGQPHAIAAGPPLFQPAKNVVKHPARIEMIENEMAKFENPDQDRFSSCLYPSSARRRSSSFSSTVATIGLPFQRIHGLCRCVLVAPDYGTPPSPSRTSPCPTPRSRSRPR